MFRADSEGNVFYVNPAWCVLGWPLSMLMGCRYEITGFPQGQTENIVWGPYIAEDHREDVFTLWERCIRSNEPMLEHEWQYTNGRWGE
jgi:hypothetical protein